jgi:hypothetical protein
MRLTQIPTIGSDLPVGLICRTGAARFRLRARRRSWRFAVAWMSRAISGSRLASVPHLAALMQATGRGGEPRRPLESLLFEVLGYAVMKLGVFCADVRLSLSGPRINVVRFLKRELKLLTEVRSSAAAAHGVQFVRCKLANFAVQIGHVIPLFAGGETIPAAMRRAT